MAKTRRRGGGVFDGVKSFFGFKSKEEKCAAAKKKADEECAPATPITDAQATSVGSAAAEVAGAPAVPATTGARRRRHQTRRKYKGGKHRRGH